MKFYKCKTTPISIWPEIKTEFLAIANNEVVVIFLPPKIGWDFKKERFFLSSKEIIDFMIKSYGESCLQQYSYWIEFAPYSGYKNHFSYTEYNHLDFAI